MPSILAKPPEPDTVPALTTIRYAGKIFPPAFWYAPGGEAAIYHGNCIKRLADLPARSVHCVVTSPPYWNLRDYGTGEWVGGDEACDHKGSPLRSDKNRLGSGRGAGDHEKIRTHIVPMGPVCKKCGAKRIDQQLGAEPSPDCGTHGQAQCGGCFVCSMVAVFRGVRRVLRDDGTLWLNLGDSYAAGGNRNGSASSTLKDGKGGCAADAAVRREAATPVTGLPPGNLVGIPWRVALALQADGWVLRSAMPWIKVNAMPESCMNRPSKAVEDVFLLTKCEDYYFDMEAVRRGHKSLEDRPDKLKRIQEGRDYETEGNKKQEGLYAKNTSLLGSFSSGGRQFRNSDLWYDTLEDVVGVGDEIVAFDVPVASYPGAHFATYPPRLITPMIRAGTSEHGCCGACGTPWERVVDRQGGVMVEPDLDGRDRSLPSNGNGITGSLSGVLPTSTTVGWRQACACKAGVVPCVVLDLFLGSGTTVATAILHGRYGVGIDLSDTYIAENAIPRITAAIAGERVTRKSSVVIPPGTAPRVRILGK